MERWTQHTWSPTDTPTRAGRWAGSYWSFVPFTLAQQPTWQIYPETARAAAKTEKRMQAMGQQPQAAAFEAFSRFLLRSEAVASSRIEGIAPAPRKVVLAELHRQHDQQHSAYADAAAETVQNLRIIRTATQQLAAADDITWADIESLQQELLPGFSHLGTRTTQNWLGGSGYHPGEAEFVPPAPELLPELIDDLIDFINGAATGGLIQAGLVHAQFETLHPFADGNGRIGRALIHTVLTRRGLTRGAVLPLSQLLLTWQQRHVDGLSTYRGISPQASMTGSTAPQPLIPPAWTAQDINLLATDVQLQHEALSYGMNTWLSEFIAVADSAIDIAEQFDAALQETLEHLRERVRKHAERPPRADSAAWSLIDALPTMPILTVNTAQKLIDRSFPTVKTGLELLVEAGVLTTLNVAKGTRGYECRELLDLIAIDERQLASTRLDTHLSPPRRPAPNPR